MNAFIRFAFTIMFTFFLSAAISLLCPLTAQVNSEDPFRGNYMLGENSEIAALDFGNWDSLASVTFTFIDANGDIATGGLNKLNSQSVEQDWDIHGDWDKLQADLATGDFDADGLDDVIGVWNRPDSTIVLYVPEIDRNSYSWVNATRMSVQDDGFPKVYETDEDNLRGWIRMMPGQFDEDAEPEFVLAYWANTGDKSGGPIQIILYDTDGTLIPRPKASVANKELSPFIENANYELINGSRFDIATGDFDRDGTDEIVLLSVEPGPEVNGTVRGKLVSTIYDFENAQIVEKVSLTISEHESYEGLAVTTGDFNGDLFDEVALGFERTGYILSVSSDLDSININSAKDLQIFGSISITSGDVNLDGREEIIVAGPNQLFVIEPDDNLNLDNVVESARTGYSSNKSSHRLIALTDMDLSDSDTLQTEFITAGFYEMLVYQNTRDGDEYNIGGDEGRDETASIEPEAPVEYGSFYALAAGDFDGDAVRLGPPTRQTVTNITQPLVVLNAPPIHYDIVDGEIYDINKCFDADFRINCEHRSIYENASSSKMEVSTQVNADWGVSESIEAGAGADFGFIKASVEGSLGRKYGGGFSNIEGSAETVTVKVTSDAIEDDRIYATISNYDILEYPVYAKEATRQGSVIAVVPKLKGLESLRNTWMGSKSGNARDYISDHEVGNILSYRSEVTLPDSAEFFDSGNTEGGGGDSWVLSGNATHTWELRFSKQSILQRERSVFQQVSSSAEASVGGGFGPFRTNLTGKVSDRYDNEQISTHRTTVREESALMVEFGTIDATILGSKTYTVSPYVYWASNGALVLDYAVNPDVSAGVPSWWEEVYGANPDLTMNLPWKYDQQKGIGSTNPAVQKEETRDIIFNPQRPVAGDKVTISARIQNYSLTDNITPLNVRFYLGDPRNGGELLADENGNSVINISQIQSRESRVAKLSGWIMPDGLNRDSKIYVVIDEEDSIGEVHEDNNIAWALVNPELGMATSNEDKIAETPQQHRLYQNYPNPFNPSTTIGFELGESGRVALDVFDIAGRKVAELIDGPMAKGYHTVRFDGSVLSSGVYFYRLSTSGFVQTRKLVLVK
ncbi:T9SS type A sorting domain-containing protein [Rhodohalobacter sp. 8-1]|uniref:T9SS type A sorting domain-containing protein n=1 Tax=Rhodohalobacter sp. 8-1 TaxID=3131972 RepID=UPI0030EC0BE6